MAIDTSPVKQYPEWVKGTARIDGNELVLDANGTEEYSIDEAEHREALLQDLAALSRPNPQRAIDFVGRHGLLWHGPEAVGNGECRESLGDWQSVARILRSSLHLLTLLQRVKMPAHRQSVSLQLRRLADRGILPTPIPEDDQGRAEFASRYLARRVNEGLANCSQTLIPAHTLVSEPTQAGDPSEFRFGLYLPNLEAVAFAQLASHIVDKTPVARCDRCGGFFTPTHGNQRYCEPRCSARARKAKQRAKTAR
jgi:hypothetical protein